MSPGTGWGAVEWVGVTQGGVGGAAGMGHCSQVGSRRSPMCVCGVGYHPSIVIVAPIVASVVAVVVMDDVVRIVVVAGSKNTT